jgi:hypothetical protein
MSIYILSIVTFLANLMDVMGSSPLEVALAQQYKETKGITVAFLNRRITD